MMTIPQKLQLTLRLSGLTQEKLAAELGVSFVALNRWIKDRSVPHPKAQARIDELYLRYTGQKVIPADLLQAKKGILERKKKEYKNPLQYILDHPDLLGQFMLSLTYNTNRIEGSTLTEAETADILFRDRALPNKHLVEQLEVKNHQTALQYLFNYLSHSGKIDEPLILKLHAMLMNSIRDDAGFYRRHGVRIIGANIPTANYIKVPVLMTELFQKIKKTLKDPIAHAALIHSAFEKIHPFSDGNGRIGRLLMNAMLLRKNFPPAIIRQEKRQLYYSYLNKSQQEAGDSSLLEDFICDAILEGFEIMRGASQ